MWNLSFLTWAMWIIFNCDEHSFPHKHTWLALHSCQNVSRNFYWGIIRFGNWKNLSSGVIRIRVANFGSEIEKQQNFVRNDDGGDMNNIFSHLFLKILIKLNNFAVSVLIHFCRLMVLWKRLISGARNQKSAIATPEKKTRIQYKWFEARKRIHATHKFRSIDDIELHKREKQTEKNNTELCIIIFMI